MIGIAEAPAPLFVELVLGDGDRWFTIRRPIVFKWSDPVLGERYRPLEVTPEVMITPSTDVLLFPNERPRELRVTLESAVAPATGVLRLELPAGWQAESAVRPFVLAEKGGKAELSFPIRPPQRPDSAMLSRGTLRLVAEVGGKQFSRGVYRIDYPHIPMQVVFPVSEVKLVRFNLALGVNRIGYIPGAGDQVAACLRQVGYQVTLLTDEILSSFSFEQYEAIIVGVRAYNTNPRLSLHHKTLMAYVASGGTLVAQYSTDHGLRVAPTEIGPYPLELSAERVCDAGAEVSLEEPSNPLFAAPNRIDAADFDGWVQERGLNFARWWDDRYQPLLSMHDPGEPPRRGGLLLARHGEGVFIYTGLSFFRQLPAGVPGAYRLLANLLAHARSLR